MAKELERLNLKFQGIREMDELPGALFVVDIKRDIIAVKEARQAGVKIIAIVDTNVDPSLVDYPIPGNDDAFTSVQYILSKIQEVLLGNNN
jgi:small subunit ribosomal protein S2